MISTWDYKQDRPLVLAFAGRDSALPRELARHYDDYRAANAEVLAVVPEAPREDLPFPALVDTAGSATSRYVERTPTVLVTDASGVLEGRFDGERPDHTRILALIDNLEMRCPECGAPEWPVE